MINSSFIRPAHGIDDNHHIVGVVAAYTPNHSFCILLISTDINKSENLLALFDNLTPSQLAEHSSIYNTALRVETQNLLRN